MIGSQESLQKIEKDHEIGHYVKNLVNIPEFFFFKFPNDPKKLSLQLLPTASCLITFAISSLKTALVWF